MADVVIDDGVVMQLLSRLLDAVDAAVPVRRLGQAAPGTARVIEQTSFKIGRQRRSHVDPALGGGGALAIGKTSFAATLSEDDLGRSVYAPGTMMAYLALALDCRCAVELDGNGNPVAGGHALEMDSLEWELVAQELEDHRVRVAIGEIGFTVRRTSGATVSSFLA